MKRSIYILGVLIGVLTLGGCGSTTTTTTASDSTAPTISSVTDGNSATVAATSSTGIYPTSFDITFSEAMADTSVTTAGNITLSCGITGGDTINPTIAVAASSTANTYTVTVTDGYKYALMTCTLTVGTNVTDAAGNALAEAATYVFANACAVSEDFNANGTSCWTVATDSDYNTWQTLLNVMAGSPGSSILNYSAAEVLTVGTYKEVTVDSSGFEIVYHVKSASNAGDYYVATLLKGTNTVTGVWGKYLSLDINGTGGTVNCIVRYDDGVTGYDFNDTYDCSAYSEYYIKMVANASGFTMSYSGNGSTYTEFSGAQIANFPASASAFLDGLDNTYLMIYAIQNTAASVVVHIDKIVTSGMTASGQY